jgi:hypothetical protein
VTVGEQHMVVAGSEDGKVCLWDLQTKQLLQTLEGHTDVVLGVAAHPSRELIATGGTDKDLRSIRIWEHVREESGVPSTPAALPGGHAGRAAMPPAGGAGAAALGSPITLLPTPPAPPPPSQ